MRTMLKSKLHRATVTGADADYEGSITLDPLLIEAADIIPFQQVHVLDVDNGSRLTTYAIEGDRGSGQVVINGAAARLVREGDTVIVLTYTDLPDVEARSHRPLLVYVDGENRITHAAAASTAGARMPGKSVLITGTSTGIGRAAAEMLVAKGYRVLATMRTPEKGRDLAENAKANGWDLTVVPLDVRDGASVRGALDQAGDIDVLVNNAGFEVWGPLEEMTVDDVKDQFETNVYGPFRLITAVLPRMRQRGSGVIVNVSSVAGRVSAPLNGLYSASKFALEALSETIHYEVGHFGVRCHIVEPGGVATPFPDNRRLVGAAAGDEGSPYRELITQWEAAADRLTGGARAQPEDVAAAILDAIETGDKLRYPVGQDANLVFTARKAMDDAQFESAMRQQLGLAW